MQDSALDMAFPEILEPADIVYFWGVLHHTGKMWGRRLKMLPVGSSKCNCGFSGNSYYNGVCRPSQSFSNAPGIYTDVVDWLGSWPIEFISVEEVKGFSVNKLGLKLINLSTGQANVEYLFRSRS